MLPMPLVLMNDNTLHDSDGSRNHGLKNINQCKPVFAALCCELIHVSY